MLLKCVVFLGFLVSCLGARKEGQACAYTEQNVTIAGICKHISNCNYERKRVFFDEKRPHMCWKDGETMIVCCPLENLRHTGRFGRLYNPLDDGIKRSATTICRYDGERHYCCPIVQDKPVPEDPACPPLHKPAPPPTLSPVQRIAWNKCVENLRYVDPCIAKLGDMYRLIRHYECGMPYVPFRIVGERDAESKEFPHMVALGVVEDPDESSILDAEWIGTGALVSDRFVLTAAHVLIDPNGRPLRYALVGSLNKKDVRNGLLHIIVRKIPHPLYSYPEKVHDIALLGLDRRVPLSSFVRPICLPVPGQDTDRDTQRLHIAYWARTGESANATELLNTAQVSLLDYSECQTKLGSSIFQYNSSTMLCVKGIVRNVAMDTCVRFGGGPLMSVLSNVNCSYRAEGVMSFGPRCGGGSTIVYTRVEHYLDWIVENVWPEEWWLTKQSHIIHFP